MSVGAQLVKEQQYFAKVKTSSNEEVWISLLRTLKKMLIILPVFGYQMDRK